MRPELIEKVREYVKDQSSFSHGCDGCGCACCSALLDVALEMGWIKEEEIRR